MDDVETNIDPTTTHKQDCICDICHKQIHCRKQISIRCNRIEHWLHIRCARIRLAQYTDTWTCHLIQTRNSRIPNTTPPLQTLVQALHSSHPHHKHASYNPHDHTGLGKPKPTPLIPSPPTPTRQLS